MESFPVISGAQVEIYGDSYLSFDWFHLAESMLLLFREVNGGGNSP